MIFQQVSENEVFKTHLLSEYKKINPIDLKALLQDPNIRIAVESPNINDQRQNEIRKNFLYYLRGNFYEPIYSQAGTIQWYKGSVNYEKFQTLKILPSDDWIEITQKTLKISDAAENIEYDKFSLLQKYRDQFNTIKKYEQNIKTIPFVPILISIRNSDQYTIIDGVKHSVATYIHYFIKSKTESFSEVQCYLGVCNNFTKWHAEALPILSRKTCRTR